MAASSVAQAIPSFQRLLFLYIVAGFASIPAGAVYAYLTVFGHPPSWVIYLVIGLGVICAMTAWFSVDRMLNARGSRKTIHNSRSDGAAIIKNGRLPHKS